MSMEEIIKVMSESEGHRVKCVEKDGEIGRASCRERVYREV